jgi:integrase/recombinase XerD
MPTKLAGLLDQILNTLDSKHTRRAYRIQLELFFAWIESAGVLTRPIILEYIRQRREAGASAAACNLALSAIRKLATEAAGEGLISPDVAKAIDSIKSIKRRGRPTGNWLTIEEAQTLIRSCDTKTLKGLRDRVMLSLLLQCGLRREEAATLQVEQIQMRGKRTLIADLLSKGNRTRTVPVNTSTADLIEQWLKRTKITHGPLLRSVNKADELDATRGEGMSSDAIYKAIRILAQKALDIDLRPHDLRRTFGKLARVGGAELDQIQHTLGHADLRTTQLYLGEYQNLEPQSAPCDMLNLENTTDIPPAREPAQAPTKKRSKKKK